MTRGGGGKTVGLGGIAGTGGLGVFWGGDTGGVAGGFGNGEAVADGDVGGFGRIAGGGGGRTGCVDKFADGGGGGTSDGGGTDADSGVATAGLPGGGGGILLRGGGGGMGGIARFGGSAIGAGRPPFEGVRGGRLIRTVSRESVAAPLAFGPVRGGKVIRTVSFFGSFRSLMRGRCRLMKLAEIADFVTR